MNPAALHAALNGDLANALAAITPGGIERQEAEGQRAMIANTQLPREMMGGVTRAQLEQLGIKFGSNVDDLFVAVTLPDGWKLQATDHSMHSDLLDQQGRKRAGIFYKAAFYDRRAHLHMVPRYTTCGYSECDAEGKPAEYGSDNHTHFSVDVLDAGKVLKHIGLCARGDHPEQERLENEAVAYLQATYPDWLNPFAYWSEPEASHA